MRKRKILSAILVITELLFLYLFHLHPIISSVVSFIRYAFMYLMLGTIFGRFSCSTNLFWDDAKKVILSNITFFLATNAMISFRTLRWEYVTWNVLTAVLMSGVAIFFNRNYRIWFRRGLVQNVVIVGAGQNAAELESIISSNRFALSKVVAVVNCNDSEKLPGVNQDIEKFNSDVIPYDSLKEYLDEHTVDEVVIALPDASREQMSRIYNDVSFNVNVVKTMPKVNGIVTYQSQVEDFDGIILISSATGLMSQDLLGLIIKRILDIIGGIVGAILLIPISIYIKIQFLKYGDKDSIFFTQERIGLHGERFKIVKYRSMITNAEEVLEKMLNENPEIKAEYEENKKLDNDPRITPIGEKLRRSSIDELPQLLNVLCGNMSLVGPRPYLPRERSDMGQYYTTIVNCKPGMTGMWQTHGRSDVSFEQRLRYDDFYYRNWSIWLDMTILFKTFRTVLTKRGAK